MWEIGNPELWMLAEYYTLGSYLTDLKEL